MMEKRPGLNYTGPEFAGDAMLHPSHHLLATLYCSKLQRLCMCPANPLEASNGQRLTQP
jgi:hypothetical protein